MSPPSGPAKKKCLGSFLLPQLQRCSALPLAAAKAKRCRYASKSPWPVLAAIRRASEVRAILSSGGPPRGRLGCQGLCRRPGPPAATLLPFPG